MLFSFDLSKIKYHDYYMVYDSEFAIVDRYHNIPAVQPIRDVEITAGGQIILMVFDFVDRSIEHFILYRFTKKY